MGKIKDLISLLRIRQWYKSVVLFIGPLFAGSMGNLSLYPALFAGLFLISFASSFNYIMNDLIDIEADKRHPEKAMKRPLAAGRISKSGGVFFMILVGTIALGGSYLLSVLVANLWVLLMVVLIIVNGVLYNFVFKYHAFLDIITLSVLYIWRALAGCLIINVSISPWLIVAIFLLALFLVISKRRADLELLGEENAANHKKIYDQYSLKMLDNLHVMILTSLFIVYILYAILGQYTLLIFSIPVALYLLMRYSFLMLTKPAIARSTEKAFLDRGMVIGLVIVLVILIFALTVPFDIFVLAQ